MVPCVVSVSSACSLFHFAGGWAHGGGLPGLGIDAYERHPAHFAATQGNQVAASLQVSLDILGQGVGN